MRSAIEKDALALLSKIREFLNWIEQSRKKNVRFIRAYKKRMGSDVAPAVAAFRQKYGRTEHEKTGPYELIMKTYSCLTCPISFMETEIRPSVGMGIFLERWMMASAVETLLKECCDEADQYLAELIKTFG